VAWGGATLNPATGIPSWLAGKLSTWLLYQTTAAFDFDAMIMPMTISPAQIMSINVATITVRII
jgi:hypothetical protein